MLTIVMMINDHISFLYNLSCNFFDLDDFLRGNPYERAQVYEILNRIGAMSIEEIREEEDMLLCKIVLILWLMKLSH